MFTQSHPGTGSGQGVAGDPWGQFPCKKNFILRRLSQPILAAVCSQQGRLPVLQPSPLTAPSSSTTPPELTPERPYQFFKTRVVIRAAMTMMRDTVIVII